MAVVCAAVQFVPVYIPGEFLRSQHLGCIQVTLTSASALMSLDLLTHAPLFGFPSLTNCSLFHVPGRQLQSQRQSHLRCLRPSLSMRRMSRQWLRS